jgi:hypothetical protein
VGSIVDPEWDDGDGGGIVDPGDRGCNGRISCWDCTEEEEEEHDIGDGRG